MSRPTRAPSKSRPASDKRSSRGILLRLFMARLQEAKAVRPLRPHHRLPSTKRVLGSKQAVVVLLRDTATAMPEAEEREIKDLALPVGRRTLVVEICSVVLEAA